MNKLKYLFTVLFFFTITQFVISQPTHTIDFEPAGVGSTWDWVVGENGDNPPLEFIANPVSGGINTSATVAQFIARQAGQPYALFFTDDDGEFTFDASNSTVKIMVYKPVMSPVHIKFEGSTGTPIELIDSNTVVNQWQELTYDFSAAIGESYNRIVILPDFYARGQDNTIYIDNIQIPDGQVIILPEPTLPAPAPTTPASSVISIYSDEYTPLNGVNLNPNWGQGTEFSFFVVQGDSSMKYGNLNYQGIELNQNLDLDSAGMQYVHVDFWSPNSTELKFFLISPGPNQQAVDLIPTAPLEQWVSVDIPLSDFEPTVDLTNVFQLMFTGNGTVYVDNIFFSETPTSVDELNDITPTNYSLEQNYPNPFNPTTNIRFNLPEANQVSVKVFNMLGEEITTLVNEYMNAGSYEVTFSAQDLPTGLYLYSITAGNFNTVKKMLLLK